MKTGTRAKVFSLSWSTSTRNVHTFPLADSPPWRSLTTDSVTVRHTAAFQVWFLCLYSLHPWFRYKTHAGEVLVHCPFKTGQERKGKGGGCTRGAIPPSLGQWVTANPCWEKNHGGKQHSDFPWKLGADAMQGTGLKCTMPFSWAVGCSWSLTLGEDMMLDSTGHFTCLSHTGPLVRSFFSPLFQLYSYPLLTHPPRSFHHTTNTHLAMACFNHTIVPTAGPALLLLSEGEEKAKNLLPTSGKSIHGRNSTNLSPAEHIEHMWIKKKK